MRPIPYEHRGQAFKRMVDEAPLSELESAYSNEADPWLRKILAVRLVNSQTEIDAQELRNLVSMNTTHGIQE